MYKDCVYEIIWGSTHDYKIYNPITGKTALLTSNYNLVKDLKQQPK